MKDIHLSNLPLRIFLCYVLQDSQRVQELYKRLCADGFNPWLEEKCLEAGQNKQQEISKTVRDSDVIIVCLSSNSVDSRGLLQEEIEIVLDVAASPLTETPTLIPLKLDRCDIPNRLKHWYWIDLSERRGYRNLKKALRSHAPNERIIHGGVEQPKIDSQEDSLEDLAYPPVIFMATTRTFDVLLKGPLGEDARRKYQARGHEEPFLQTNLFVPDRRWLGMFSEGDIRTVRDLTEGLSGISNWLGVMTIGADAFRIENGFLDPNLLRRRLKRAALLFDRILVYDLIPSMAIMEDGEVVNELTWLVEQGIIVQPELDDEKQAGLSRDYLSTYEIITRHHSRNLLAVMDTTATYNNAQTDEAREACLRVTAEVMDNMMWWQVRHASCWYREIEDTRVIPILDNSPPDVLRPRPEISRAFQEILQKGVLEPIKQIPSPKTGDVVQIILKTLPLPSDETSWQDLIDYRTDPKSRHSLSALRNWANETARLALPSNEISDKLIWLMEEYKAHIKLHKLKFKMGRAELLLTTTASAAEELIHLKPGSAAKILFDLKRNKLDLMEAEINSPGSEVAYILKAAEQFDHL